MAIHAAIVAIERECECERGDLSTGKSDAGTIDLRQISRKVEFHAPQSS